MTTEKMEKANEIANEIKSLEKAITILVGATALVNNMDGLTFHYEHNNGGRYGYDMDCLHKDTKDSCYVIKENIKKHFSTFLVNVLNDAKDKLEITQKLFREL